MEDLLASFSKRISDLKGLMLLRTSDPSESGREALLELATTLTYLEIQMSELRQYIDMEKESIALGEELLERIEDQQAYIAEIEGNLPASLPGTLAPKTPARPLAVRPTPTTANGNNGGNGGGNGGNGEASGKKSTGKRRRSSVAGGRRRSSIKPAISVPTIPLMTAEEVAAIPRYQKGRLTQDKINAAIGDINQVVATKYRILSAPTGKLGNSALRQAKIWREMETYDTLETGAVFFVEADLKAASGGNIKLDATGRSILQVLRCSGRFRELRGDGHVRFVLSE